MYKGKVLIVVNVASKWYILRHHDPVLTMVVGRIFFFLFFFGCVKMVFLTAGML